MRLPPIQAPDPADEESFIEYNELRSIFRLKTGRVLDSPSDYVCLRPSLLSINIASSKPAQPSPEDLPSKPRAFLAKAGRHCPAHLGGSEGLCETLPTLKMTVSGQESL